MKRVIALVLVMMLGFCTASLAEAPSIDLSSMSLEQLTTLREEVDAAIQKLQASKSPTDQLESATRKAPATVGQTVKLSVETYNMSYTVLVTLEEVYRGEAYEKLMKKRYKPELTNSENEYIAAKVSVTFLSIEESEEDDPELLVDAIFNFKSFDSNGAQYDNVHYGVSDEAELKPIYQGATTEGFMQFEIMKSDPAPYLVYTPDMLEETAAWFRLS